MRDVGEVLPTASKPRVSVHGSFLHASVADGCCVLSILARFGVGRRLVRFSFALSLRFDATIMFSSVLALRLADAVGSRRDSSDSRGSWPLRALVWLLLVRLLFGDGTQLKKNATSHFHRLQRLSNASVPVRFATCTYICTYTGRQRWRTLEESPESLRLDFFKCEKMMSIREVLRALVVLWCILI